MDRSWLAELDPDTVKPGAIGLLVVLALVVATVLLLRSFTHQLKKIDFDEDADGDDTDTDADVDTASDDPARREGDEPPGSSQRPPTRA